MISTSGGRQRFRVRHAGGFSAFVLMDDGRILFEPSDSRQRIFVLQGIGPPLRVVLQRNERARDVRAVIQVCGFLLATSLLFLGVAQWLAWHP